MSPNACTPPHEQPGLGKDAEASRTTSGTGEKRTVGQMCVSPRFRKFRKTFGIEPDRLVSQVYTYPIDMNYTHYKFVVVLLLGTNGTNLRLFRLRRLGMRAARGSAQVNI